MDTSHMQRSRQRTTCGVFCLSSIALGIWCHRHSASVTQDCTYHVSRCHIQLSTYKLFTYIMWASKLLGNSFNVRLWYFLTPVQCYNCGFSMCLFVLGNNLSVTNLSTEWFHHATIRLLHVGGTNLDIYVRRINSFWSIYLR